jgi:hypothetical protein
MVNCINFQFRSVRRRVHKLKKKISHIYKNRDHILVEIRNWFIFWTTVLILFIVAIFLKIWDLLIERIKAGTNFISGPFRNLKQKIQISFKSL